MLHNIQVCPGCKKKGCLEKSSYTNLTVIRCTRCNTIIHQRPDVDTLYSYIECGSHDPGVLVTIREETK